MGTYDTFIDGDISIQLKCFTCELKIYHVGDGVPYDGSVDVIAVRGGVLVIVIVRDGAFMAIRMPHHPVDDEYPHTAPMIDKWGNKLESIDDFEDLSVKLVEQVKKKLGMTMNPQPDLFGG